MTSGGDGQYGFSRRGPLTSNRGILPIRMCPPRLRQFSHGDSLRELFPTQRFSSALDLNLWTSRRSHPPSLNSGNCLNTKIFDMRSISCGYICYFNIRLRTTSTFSKELQSFPKCCTISPWHLHWSSSRSPSKVCRQSQSHPFAMDSPLRKRI